MNAIDNRKKVFEYKLNQSINFKYVSTESIVDNKHIDNSRAIERYKTGFELINEDDENEVKRVEKGPVEKTPAITVLTGCDKIKCDYAEKILEELKQKVFKDLCKEYPDYDVKGMNTYVYYHGNFINPLIKNGICDKAVITITHEKIIKKERYTEIIRYLDVVLM